MITFEIQTEDGRRLYDYTSGDEDNEHDRDAGYEEMYERYPGSYIDIF